MPGHMNVLLAEANVPYDQLLDMEPINDEFPRPTSRVVVGANDVVNPAARNQPGSPIYGMPILNVDQAKNVVVLKRSMTPGFAGIDNELFYEPKTAMLFGDAKAALEKLTAAVKAVCLSRRSVLLRRATWRRGLACACPQRGARRIHRLRPR